VCIKCEHVRITERTRRPGNDPDRSIARRPADPAGSKLATYFAADVIRTIRSFSLAVRAELFRQCPFAELKTSDARESVSANTVDRASDSVRSRETVATRYSHLNNEKQQSSARSRYLIKRDKPISVFEALDPILAHVHKMNRVRLRRGCTNCLSENRN